MLVLALKAGVGSTGVHADSTSARRRKVGGNLIGKATPHATYQRLDRDS